MTSPGVSRAITTDSVVVATKEHVSSDLGGETIVLSLQSAMYFGVDQLGTRIWELIQEPSRVTDVRDAIVGEYDVETERCEQDLLEFLRQLAANELIEVSDGIESA